VASDNVDLFHRIQREWLEQRRLGPDLLAEEAEWVNPEGAVEGGTRRGAEAFNAAISSIFEGWEESVFEPERVIEAGDDVVAIGHLRATGRAVSVEVVQPHGQIWTFRGERAVRMRWFHTHTDTLAAAGLDE
jgi:ketosteroid isomerase-like protein